MEDLSFCNFSPGGSNFVIFVQESDISCDITQIIFPGGPFVFNGVLANEELEKRREWTAIRLNDFLFPTELNTNWLLNELKGGIVNRGPHPDFAAFRVFSLASARCNCASFYSATALISLPISLTIFGIK